MFLRGSCRVCGALSTLAKSHGACVLVAENDGDDGDWGWVAFGTQLWFEQHANDMWNLPARAVL